MAEDTLIVGSSFDPSGITRGVDLAGAALVKFQQMVKRAADSLPGINVEKFLQSAVAGANAEIAALKNVQTQAVHTGSAIASLVAMQSSAVGARTGGAPIITRDKVADLRLLAGQLQQLPALENASAIGAERLAAGFAVAGESARLASAGSRAWATGLANIAGPTNQLAGSTANLGNKFELSRQGGRRLESALTGMAVAASGASGPFGQLVQGLVVFGAASIPLLEVAAAIAVTVAAYQFLTKAIREATDAQKKLIEAQQARQAAVGDPGGTQHAIIADEQRLIALRKEEAGWVKAIRFDQMFGAATVQELNKLSSIRLQILNIELAKTADINALNKQRIEDAKKLFEAGNQSIAALGLQAATLQAQAKDPGHPERVALGTAAAARLAAIATTSMTKEQRAAAIALADTITGLEKQALAFKEQTAAAEKAAKALELVLAAQHALRVEQAGGGNRPAGAGGTNTGPLTGGGLQFGATNEEAVASRAKVAIAKADADMQLFLQHALRGFTFLAGKINQTQLNAAEFVNGLRSIAIGAQVFAEAGQALGVIGEEAAKAVSNVGSLADSIASVAQANQALKTATTDADKLVASLAKVSAIGSLIGAGAGLLKQVFGESPREREHAQLLRDNTTRLAELRAGLDRQLRATDLVTAGNVLATKTVLNASPVTGLTLTPEFQKALADAGLSLELFAKIVKDSTGISILDSEGKLMAESWVIAREAMAKAIDGLLHFADTLEAQSAFLATRDKIFKTGVDPDVAALNRQRQLLLSRSNLPGEAGVAGLDLNTDAGRQAYRVWLQNILMMAKAGKLTAEQFEKLNVEELRGSIDGAADSLNTLDESTMAAAQAIIDAAEQQRKAWEDSIPSLKNLHDALNGISATPVTQFQNALVGISKTMPNIGDMLKGVSLSDPGSREELRQKLSGMIDTLLTGPGGANQLGLTQDQVGPFLAFLQQGVDALNSFAETIKKVTLAEEQAMLDLRAKLVGGTDSPVAAFNRELQALATTAPDFRKMLGNFDLADPVARAAFRQKLLDIFDQVKAGTLTAEDLGLSGDEFKKFLGDAGDALNSFDKSVQDATKSVTNLPAGVNLMAKEFQAQLAQTKNQLPVLDPSLLGPRGRKIGDAVNFTPRGSDGASLPVAVQTNIGVVNLTIDGTGQNAPQIYKEFKRLLARESMVKHGNPDGRV